MIGKSCNHFLTPTHEGVGGVVMYITATQQKKQIMIRQDLLMLGNPRNDCRGVVGVFMYITVRRNVSNNYEQFNRNLGARVAQNVRLADMNLDASVQDDRCIEVVCNGLPLWHGAQLAVDATIVSPVGRTGEPRAGADVRPALALDQPARRKRHPTYPPTCTRNSCACGPTCYCPRRSVLAARAQSAGLSPEVEKPGLLPQRPDDELLVTDRLHPMLSSGRGGGQRMQPTGSSGMHGQCGTRQAGTGENADAGGKCVSWFGGRDKVQLRHNCQRDCAGHLQ